MPQRFGALLLVAVAWPSQALAQAPKPPPAESDPQVSSHLHPAPIAPVSPGELDAAIAQGVAYLCRTQNRDGSWGSSRWTGGVDQDPVPGAFQSFSTATTALCLEALQGAGDSPEMKKAAAWAETFLVENLPKLRRADPDNLPNVWGYTYGIQALANLAGREPAGSKRRRQLDELISDQIRGLEHFETVHGGWFYYASGLQRPLAPSASFVNAAVLVALDRARALGSMMDSRVLKRRSKPQPVRGSPTRATFIPCRARSTCSKPWPRSIDPQAASDVRKRATWRCGSGAIRGSPTRS